jgi:hypothetical protein
MNKINSRKFWFSVWASISFTALGGLSIWKEVTPSWMATSMPVLVGIVAAYVGIGRWKEKEK